MPAPAVPDGQPAAMPGDTRVTHVIAYDIRDPKRLKRVHARTVAAGLRLHYSLYAADLTPLARDGLLADIAALIDPAVDDVRLYQVPEPPRGGWRGPDQLGPGILIPASPAARLIERLRAGRP